jgi:hypothetical protein
LIDGAYWDYNLTILDFDGKQKDAHTKVQTMAVSPDGSILILAHCSLKLLIRDIDTNRQIDEFILAQAVHAIEIFPDSLKFATLSYKYMQIYDILTHAVLH